MTKLKHKPEQTPPRYFRELHEKIRQKKGVR